MRGAAPASGTDPSGVIALSRSARGRRRRPRALRGIAGVWKTWKITWRLRCAWVSIVLARQRQQRAVVVQPRGRLVVVGLQHRVQPRLVEGHPARHDPRVGRQPVQPRPLRRVGVSRAGGGYEGPRRRPAEPAARAAAGTACPSNGRDGGLILHLGLDLPHLGQTSCHVCAPQRTTLLSRPCVVRSDDHRVDSKSNRAWFRGERARPSCERGVVSAPREVPCKSPERPAACSRALRR